MAFDRCDMQGAGVGTDVGGDNGGVQEDLATMRRRYSDHRLLEGDVASDPLGQFRTWLHEAVEAGITEPNAMVLATVDADGQPNTRTVLLKGIEDDGFVFFTNHGSRKAADIAANQRVSLCFPWIAMERQVVVTGRAARVPDRVNETYWATRPRESQIGAWASHQSTVIASRAELESAAAAVARRFPAEVPLPPFWGGYVVVPHVVEFWQGGPARLHDRLRYRPTAAGWIVERLAP